MLKSQNQINKEKELQEISKSLLIFWGKNKSIFEKNPPDVVFNVWTQSYQPEINFYEHVEWCMNFIQDLKKKKPDNESLILDCIIKYS